MRAPGQPDAFPSGDIELLRNVGVKSSRDLEQRAEAWRIWRAYAARRLRNTAEPMSKFIAAVQPLYDARKLGPVLFQLPPNFRLDLPRFKEFLSDLPTHLQTVFEFRHSSWFCAEVYALLHEAGAALCAAESGTSKSPAAHTANFSYLRMRKKRYSIAERRKLARKVNQLMQRGDVFVFFKHDESPEGALRAEELLRLR